MKIAELTPFFYPVEGGVERHVLNLSKQLIKLGHEVYVFTTNASHMGKLNAPQSEIVDGVHLSRFNTWFSLGKYAKFWPSFIQDLKDHEFDVVHTHVYRHPHSEISRVIAKLKKERCVLTSHSPFYPLATRGRLQYAVVFLYDLSVGRLITLNKFNAIISVTKYEFDLLRKMGAPADKLYLIPNGVEVEHFKGYKANEFLERFELDESRVVLYLGRLEKTKGLTFLLSAFKLVTKTVTDAKLVIAGEDEGEKLHLQSMINSLNLNGKVFLTGFLSDEMKKQAYSACDLFVLPSIYEGFGMVMLEAMAHGKPVIATYTADPGCVIEDHLTGYHVNYGDQETLAERIITLLRDSFLSEKFGENAKKEARKYSWDSVASLIEDVYIKIL